MDSNPFLSCKFVLDNGLKKRKFQEEGKYPVADSFIWLIYGQVTNTYFDSPEP